MAGTTSPIPILRLRGTTLSRNVFKTASTPTSVAPKRRYAASVAGPAKAHHRVVVVGGGTAGVTVAAQLKRTGRFQKDDIAILDPAATHYYQPGWTLVGSGLKSLQSIRRPESSVIPAGVKHYPLAVSSFDPSNDLVRTSEGADVSYDYLIVATGLEVNFAGVRGLQEALQDPTSPVSSIYSDKTVEKVRHNVQAIREGNAIFTQPVGTVKCAGAAQKIMWMAISQWKRNGVRPRIDVTFASGLPAMFAVPKYSQALENLRVERQVRGLFQHNLVRVDAKNKVATFQSLKDGNKEVDRKYDFLHVVPPQKPWDWVAKSPLADAAGWVDVNQSTTQHNKFPNVFSLGDASSLPCSKTAAAITSQAPVLVDNLLASMDQKPLKAVYDGYASCPILTGHNELMLCEFKYGGVPKESFATIFGGQEKPNWLYYYLKKDFFPFVYWNAYLKGTWYGPHAFFRPNTSKP